MRPAVRWRPWPIGRWANVQKLLNASPPRMEGDLVLHPSGGPISVIDEAAWAVENRVMSGASIGFLPDWDQIERVNDVHPSSQLLSPGQSDGAPARVDQSQGHRVVEDAWRDRL